MAWKFNSSTPIYLQITDRVMADILGGRYPAGARLPSVRELGMEAGVNPNTVQRAMAELENRGAVTALMGDGRYVTDNESAIADFRARSSKEATEDFARKMLSLQIDRETAEALLNKAFEKYTSKED